VSDSCAFIFRAYNERNTERNAHVHTGYQLTRLQKKPDSGYDKLIYIDSTPKYHFCQASRATIFALPEISIHIDKEFLNEEKIAR